MGKLLYNDFLGQLQKDIDAALSLILSVHNFELGPEFEIAFCEVLKKVLPQKYGVCRGFLVNEAGSLEGDDIVIYDQGRFPSIRGLGNGDLSRKNQIPIESAYGYIECKNTIDLSFNKVKDKSGLGHAIKQAQRVKALASKRDPVPPEYVGNGVHLPKGMYSFPLGYPSRKDPFFAAVIARQVKIDSKIIEDPEKIEQQLASIKLKNDPNFPDLIVLGKSNIVLPSAQVVETGDLINSGFYLPNISRFDIYKIQDLAFSVGVGWLLWALDWILLDRFPYHKVVGNALGKYPSNLKTI